MIDLQTVGQQPVLGLDHILISVARELGVHAVAGLARSPSAETVGQDDVVSVGVKKLARAKQFAGEGRGQHGLAGTGGAVEHENGVDDTSVGAPPRLTQRNVMKLEVGQHLAALEAEAVDEPVTFDLMRVLSRSILCSRR